MKNRNLLPAGVAGAVFAALCFISPLSAPAEIRSAELRVNGLTCPFCAFGIEKKLRKVDGVREVEVLLDEGRILLTFTPENTATLTDLERAVADAGFALVELHLTALGRLTQEGEREIFEVAPRLRFRLVGPRSGGGQSLSPEIRERLEKAASLDSLLIGGEVRRREDELPSLSVERVEATAADGA